MSAEKPFFERHPFGDANRGLIFYSAYHKVESLKGSRKRLWQDSVEGAIREIYIRLPCCWVISRLGNGARSRSEPIMIDRSRYVGPCVVCTRCGAHHWVILEGYEPSEHEDVFLRNFDQAKEWIDEYYRRRC